MRWAEHLCELIGRNNPEGLDTLAAAHARAGNFLEATSIAAQAASLADSQRRGDLAASIRRKHSLYAAGQAYVEPR